MPIPIIKGFSITFVLPKQRVHNFRVPDNDIEFDNELTIYDVGDSGVKYRKYIPDLQKNLQRASIQTADNGLFNINSK
jgi:hypothetical protein